MDGILARGRDLGRVGLISRPPDRAGCNTPCWANEVYASMTSMVLKVQVAPLCLLTLAGAGLLFARLTAAAGAEFPTSQGIEFFEARIRPIFVDHCYKCHSSKEKFKGGLTLDTREGVLKGGDSGPVIHPGFPDKSRLIEAVRYKNLDFQMPPKSPLRPDQVRDLEKWVQMGAPDPRDSTPTAALGPRTRPVDLEEGKKFWAFQPINDPPLPQVESQEWIRSPIDAFILAKLEKEQIKPARGADRRALLRRATFDLTGLPPKPNEMASFLSDSSPDAFAKVVDRLLESPRYGERWGRHWMDVARYADSNGLDENVAFGNAWRYRDYVVRAFNQDKPFDQFLIEQLAGDLLPPTGSIAVKHERLTALGFLSLGPKLLAETDKVKLEMDFIDEQIETIGRAFLGVTLGCARCHDHKFDPVPTEDYYALAAIFKSTHTMDDLRTVARWHEPEIALPKELETKAAFDQLLDKTKFAVTNLIATANKRLLEELKTNSLPANPESRYPTNTLSELKTLKEQLKKLEAEAPELSSAMGVKDGTNILKTFPVHIRGSHLTLGKPVPRGVPRVMTGPAAPAFGDHQSGRLELARWLASREHPLTARVIVNRIWSWHFGRGLVDSTDNFGALGDLPSHPDLLDWLARHFIKEDWSMKAMHRLIMRSSTYQMAASKDPVAALRDPDNRLLSHFPIRRLEAEEIRDALLSVAESLDLTMGGKTIPVKNREFVFNHTSRDATTYESTRRALYLPIIRNHLYDFFEQFDYPDPAVPTGNRGATVIAPQALLMMNSELVEQVSSQLAARLLKQARLTDAERVEQISLIAYGRPPAQKELERALAFLRQLQDTNSKAKTEPGGERAQAWGALCQTFLAANEFIYLQ